MTSRTDVAIIVAAPLEGPIVSLNGKPGRNEAELVWSEIPKYRRQGFITSYTIYCTSETSRDTRGMYLSHGFLNRLETMFISVGLKEWLY